MISDKDSSGRWSEPYEVRQLKNKEFIYGIALNSAGTRIYYGLNNDIYFTEQIGKGVWSIPLRVDAISSEDSEVMPSPSRDEHMMGLLKSIRSASKQRWSRVPHISTRTDTGWTRPTPMRIEGFPSDTDFDEFVLSPTGNTAVLGLFTGTSFRNFLGVKSDSSFTSVRELNFSAGRVQWLSEDGSTALAQTFSEPSKLVMFRLNTSATLADAKQPTNIVSPLRSDVNTEANATVKPSGKYYALLIGVSKYQDPSLMLANPVNDIVRLQEILISKYSFEKSDVLLLMNPTRRDILSQLIRMRSIITSQDNLLIFFAGHGFWDKSIEQGYWWPSDAGKNDPSFWLSNSDLREQLRGIRSGHTLLISDACFSGGIFRARGTDALYQAPADIQLLYRTKSRRAMTSGSLSSVPDKSVFFDYLAKRLSENQQPFLSSQQLFYSLRTPVMNNSLTVPQEGVISDCGDEGGDFIFILREK